MAKELTWKVTVDGSEHTVSCVTEDTRYVLWVDEEESTVVRPTSGNRILESSIMVAGKPCLFVVINQVPDLVVDGILLNSGKNYMDERNKYQKRHVIIGIVLIILSAVMLVICGFMHFIGRGVYQLIVVAAGMAFYGVLSLSVRGKVVRR